MIADLKPYVEYKDSGLPWLGQVPEHWNVRRMKLLLREVDSRTTSGKEQLLRVSQYTGVTQRKSVDGSEAPDTRASSLIGYKRVMPSDLVINIMLAWNGSMGVSRYDGIASPAYCVYRLKPGAMPWYYHELLRLPLYKGRIKTASTGVVESRLRLYSDDLGRIEVIQPPLDEQAAIVRFLDWANGRLERAIRAKRKVIALLGEQKQAIIHRAVTRGLDPSAPLKPSGIPWLGDIPQHWDFRAFARLARVVRGASPRPAGDKRYFYGTHIPWLTVGEVTKDGEIYLKRTETFLTQLGLEHSVRFPQGTLVLTNSGATLGVPKILAVEVCANDGIVAFLRLNLVVDPVFAYYYLSTLTVRLRDELRQGGTQPNLNTGIVRSIACPLPPKAEQQAILEFLEAELTGIRTAISRLEREIELLREFRTRLVADVVTGKLDVREAAAKLPEESDDPERFDGADALTEGDEDTDGEALDRVAEEAEA